MNEYCLTEEFCKHHFLVGLLMQEVRTSLNEIVQIRKVAIGTLRDLMAKHELDDRYQNKVRDFEYFNNLFKTSHAILLEESVLLKKIEDYIIYAD